MYQCAGAQALLVCAMGHHLLADQSMLYAVMVVVAAGAIAFWLHIWSNDAVVPDASGACFVGGLVSQCMACVVHKGVNRPQRCCRCPLVILPHVQDGMRLTLPPVEYATLVLVACTFVESQYVVYLFLFRDYQFQGCESITVMRGASLSCLPIFPLGHHWCHTV